MKKSEIDILNNIEKTSQNNKHLNQLPKTPQKAFLLTYAAIYFITKGINLPILKQLLDQKTGTNSQLLLRLKYMKQCLQAKVNLDDKSFHVINTLFLWTEELQKINRDKPIKLVNSILLPHPSQLRFQHYQEFFVYLNYIAGDIQNLFKAGIHQWAADDLILLLELALPKIHYNIILPGSQGQKLEQQAGNVHGKQNLFFNESIQYFTRTKMNYRGLCRMLIYTVIKMDLKPTQMRLIVDLACRYYLLFWADPKQVAAEIFVKSFEKVTEAVRFSLTDQLILFFKVSNKIGANHLEGLLRQKSPWIDTLLTKYANSCIGYSKDEVSPFNPLKLRQILTVEARKSVSRTIEVYRQFSLMYFTALVEDYDISIKLYYLGDFQSKIQVKKMVHPQEKKSGEAKFAFIANKRGLYMIEFDNSYSWLNSKNISFQYVVLSHFGHMENSKWLANLYELDSVPTNKGSSHKNATTEGFLSGAPQETIRTHNLQDIYISEGYASNQLYEEQFQLEKKQVPHKQIEQVYQNQIKTSQKTPKVQEYKQEEKPLPTKAQKQMKTAQKVQTKQEKKQVDKSLNHPPHKQIKQQQLGKIPMDGIPGIETKLLPANNGIPLDKKVVSQGPKIGSQHSLGEQVAGQANLTLIDGIFSLLVNTEEHTYEFQTNLEDRINKRVTSYCQSEQRFQWIVNSQARDWLKKHQFILHTKGGSSILSMHRKSQVSGEGSKKISR